MLLVALLLACADEAPLAPTTAVAAAKSGDADGDGDPTGSDCDDGDPTVYTGAPETCDAIDQDCDGVIDDGACPCTDDTDGDHAFLFCTTRSTWADAQAACASWGYHLADVEDTTEEAWIWTVAEATDPATGWWHGLNDRDVEGTYAWDGGGTSTWTHWRAGEPNDYGGGEDCASFADDGAGAWNDKGCGATLAYVCEAGCLWSSWYEDADGDGYGEPATLTRACTAPAGTIADGSDCDDADPAISPAASEACGGGDEDCDGLVDDADAAVTGASIWYADGDGDGAGDAASPAAACVAPTGYVATDDDCEDTDATIYPGAAEIPVDGVDQDCSGADACTWYRDADGDGYGDPASALEDCGSPSGYVGDATDCDDGDANIHPGATETFYDGVDDDCDGGGDDDDADGDGDPALAYGGGDCDDGDATVATTAVEACDATDDDCDGAVDEDACTVPTLTWNDHTYLFFPTTADRATAAAACASLGYHLADVADAAEDAWLWAEADAADDGTGWWMGYADLDVEGTFTWEGGASFTYTNWRAGEPNDFGGNEDCGAWSDDSGGVWNDKDCAMSLAYVCEAGCTQVTAWTDADGDGYGDGAVITCEGTSGTVATGGDCDDTNATISPSEAERCDDADVDEDCDGLADDADDAVTAPLTWFTDADGDGFGDPDAIVLACDLADGRVADATDCDDGDATVFPGAAELENGRDDDCDGVGELDDTDDDGLDRAVEEALGTDPEAADSDRDGLGDAEEVEDPDSPTDTDEDGLIDAIDPDDDGDRLTTVGELATFTAEGGEPDDSDLDGTPDHLDLDSDDDGVPDGLDDGLDDLDLDGIADEDDPDDDGDGVPTLEEGTGDTDGDGLADYRDPTDDTEPAADDTGGPGVDKDGSGNPPDCGCASSAAPTWLGVVALALIGVRRRR